MIPNSRTSLLFLLVGIISLSPAAGFDPAGPPPEKNIEWTVGYLSNVVVNRIEFDDSTRLQDSIDFLELSLGAPPKYRVKVDASALGKERLDTVIGLKGVYERLRLIEVLAKIADAASAKIVIEEGKVLLIPKQEAVRLPDEMKPPPTE